MFQQGHYNARKAAEQQKLGRLVFDRHRLARAIREWRQSRTPWAAKEVISGVIELALDLTQFAGDGRATHQRLYGRYVTSAMLEAAKQLGKIWTYDELAEVEVEAY